MAGVKACRGARRVAGAGQGGGEAADAANGEKIWSTVKEKEAMAVAATEGRRKRRQR